MKENKCYDPDCDEEECYDPEHFNFICFNPDCEEIHCENKQHFNKQLLKDYQENTDLSVICLKMN